MIIREFAEADRPQALVLLGQHAHMVQEETEQVLGEGQRLVAVQDGVVCGLAALVPGQPGFYSFVVLVDPTARRQGIGDALWRRSLYSLPADAEMVCCACPGQNTDGQAFLQARAFTPWFSEELMQYSGSLLPDPQLTAKQYTDADFEDWVGLINSSFYPIRKANDIRPHTIFDVNSPTIRQRLRNTSNEHLLFYDGDQLIGLAGIVGSTLDPIAVAEGHRGKGYGRRITAYCTNLVLSRGQSTVNLGVASSNTIARRLYESTGYRVIERIDWFRLLLGQH